MAPPRSTPWELSTLLHDVPGRKDFGRPLAPFTSIRIGGPADNNCLLLLSETCGIVKRLTSSADPRSCVHAHTGPEKCGILLLYKIND